MEVYYKKRGIDIKIKKVSKFGKYSGLMLKYRNTGNLLFEFPYSGKWKIHSYFVFFPFLAIWLDENNKVLEWKVIKPFIPLISPDNSFRRLIEIPINNSNSGVIDFFVGKRKDLNT